MYNFSTLVVLLDTNKPTSTMKKKLSLLLPLLFFAAFINAQEANTGTDNSLKGQFDQAIDDSNDWTSFKVIKKSTMIRLRKNVLDSVVSLESQINELNGKISEQKQQIATLTTDLGTTQGDLSLSQEKEDGIEIFGTILKKSTYNTILWSIIGLLLLALGFFIYRFKNSNAITKDAKLRLAETESEFDAHRQKKLEEQQQLRRKLQDEINKNRKVSQ